MNPLDIAVVAIVVLSAVFAFARGFVREALSIVAWVGAAAATFYGFGPAFERIDPLVKNPLLSQLIAVFGLFVGSLIILTIVTSFIARTTPIRKHKRKRKRKTQTRTRRVSGKEGVRRRER